MKRKFGYKQLLLGLTLTLAMTGCANAKTKTDPAASGSGTGTKTETPAAKQLKVKTYYADDNLDKLIEREANVTYATDADKYKAALDALKTAPEASLSSLSKGITYRSVTNQSGNLTVDISIADNGRLGAPGEDLLVQSIRKSLFQFSEVQTIEVLLDGKKIESLMGHVSLPHPMKRN
ncbi:GerMN domain-containing protein [Paenibacillus mesophilus]|uniref:GerMN domain-containing protein n=1 Tax=Paenibacillus mesophilus TaxID=2582849 RepID=UPI00110D9554|nr:GerMN domain-containing protein [Paenibacillus mesophilus]TMV51196.1 GerMN domain-containing protein [Paenibacillus mesophilus]